MSTSASPSTPEIITTAAEMRAWSRKQRLAGKRVGFVPTMVTMIEKKKRNKLVWLDFDLSVVAPALLSPFSPLFVLLFGDGEGRTSAIGA